jgi:K+/H+ antiporter YhaU regulatory subunit KhtT
MNVDSETRIDNVSVLPNNTIWYQYTLLNIEKSSANIEEMKQEKQKLIFDWMKVNAQSKVMFDKNISMNFSFLDKNWEFLFDVVLTPKMFK